MNTLTLIYHFAVITISLVIFFMEVTAENAVIELIAKILGKIVPLFCIFYAGIEIFKYFGVI